MPFFWNHDICLMICFAFQFPYLICPIEYSAQLERMTMSCEPSALFRPQEYGLPDTVTSWRRILGMKETVTFYPFFIHCFFMSLFASIIGPFGGFFASGFKRAFKIKDFGDLIPGHGGIMDRFDCQFLMATFVNVYIHSFINIPTPGKVCIHFIFKNAFNFLFFSFFSKFSC